MQFVVEVYSGGDDASMGFYPDDIKMPVIRNLHNATEWWNEHEVKNSDITWCIIRVVVIDDVVEFILQHWAGRSVFYF